MIIAMEEYYAKKLAGLPKATQDRVVSSMVPLELFGSDGVMVKASCDDGHVSGLEMGDQDPGISSMLFSEIRTALRPTASEKGDVIWDEEDM